MEEKADTDQGRRAVALLWQGHMLDLLGKREAAVSKYRVVAVMGLAWGPLRHDQYRLVYTPSPYTRERMTTPFTRLENQGND